MRPLEDIIAQNRIGRLLAIRSDVEERFAVRQREYLDVEDAVTKVREQYPQGLGVDIATEDGRRKAAGMMGMEVARFERYMALGKKEQEAFKAAIGLDDLKEEGMRALREVATEIAALPAERPLMVFYTAEWCGPCAWVKPDIAALAPYLDIPFYYSEDDALRKAEEVTSIPRLVLYTAEGKVHSYPWMAESTAELWDIMRGLSAQSYRGTGLFECKDGMCGVTAYDPERH